jgi:hypothetical protein
MKMKLYEAYEAVAICEYEAEAVELCEYEAYE